MPHTQRFVRLTNLKALLKFESIALSVIVYSYGMSQNCRSDELFLCYSIPQNTPPVTRNVQ